MDSKPSSSIRVQRFASIAPAALFALLLLAVYRDPLFTGRNFVGRDLVPYGLPMEKAVHDAWARGRLPVWSEDVSGGRPLFPNPSAGPLYPLRPLVSRLPFPTAMRILPVAQWFIGGLGMLVALRALAVSPAGAWVGAATFVFSGVLVSDIYYTPLLPSATLLPWVLWSSARAASRLGARAVPQAVVFGLLFLVGDAFGLAVGILVALLWIASETPRGARGRELGALAAGMVLAALLAAPQIAATALVVPETHRAVSGLTVREAVAFTVSPWRLFELVVPFPFGPFWSLEDREVWGSAVFRPFFATLYCGSLAAIALVVLWRDRGRGSRFSRALVVVGAFLAIAFRFLPQSLGDRASWVPLRFPEKFAVAMTLGLSVVAALGFDRFRVSAKRPSWTLPLAVGIAAAASGAAIWPSRAGALAVSLLGAPATPASGAGAQIAASLAEAGLLWTTTLVALEALGHGRAGLAAAVLLLTLVPVASNRRVARTEVEGAVFPPTAFARTLARRDPPGDFRTIDETPFRPPSPLAVPARGDPYLTESDRQDWAWATQGLWRRGTVLNLDPDRGDFSRVESLRRISTRAAADPNGGDFFAALSLRFGIRYPDQAPLPGFRPFARDARRVWDENPSALPDLRLVETWREEPGAVDALGVLPRLAPGEVVFESGRRASGAARPGTLRVLEKSPERLVLEADCPDATWLFVLRGFWEHRTVRVDGERVAVRPAQLAFSAVPLPAGRHRVVWCEEAPGLAVSRWGPALFGLLAAGLVAHRRFSRAA